MTNTHKDLHIVILAAGKGTRMKSEISKVMHPLAGLPMIGHVIKTANSLKPHCITVVTAPAQEDVKDFVAPHKIAIQDKQLGTGHALKCALESLKSKTGTCLVLYGDGPLYTKTTLSTFLKNYAKSKNKLGFLGMIAADPIGYGRMILDNNQSVSAIVEEKDASAAQKKIDLCWTGVMCGDVASLRKWVGAIDNKNKAGEYYLTALPVIASKNKSATFYDVCPEDESLGANTRGELARLEQKIQERLRGTAMENGATLLDPATTYFSHDTKIGKDVLIEPNVFFGPDVTIGDHCHIKAFSHIEGATLKKHVVVGPFARLRPGTVLEAETKIGNFVELKNTSLGQGSKVNHLTYVGDSKVGKGSNIGAGTITCNYDGFDKHKTTIGDGVFVGSNSTLIAPLTLKNGAYVAAGSVIAKDVSKDALAMARSRQSEKAGWAKSYREKKKKKS